MTRIAPAGLIVALAVTIVDQAIKLAVTGPLGIDHLGAYREIVGVFDLRFVPNFGISLGLLGGHGGPIGWLLDHLSTCSQEDIACRQDVMRWSIVVLTGAIATGVLLWLLRETNRQDRVALGLVLGGAIGNILDRIRLGYVVDYADLHFGTWRPFLVFNVADAAITIGVLVLLVRALLVRDEPKAAPEQAPVEKINA